MVVVCFLTRETYSSSWASFRFFVAARSSKWRVSGDELDLGAECRGEGHFASRGFVPFTHRKWLVFARTEFLSGVSFPPRCLFVFLRLLPSLLLLLLLLLLQAVAGTRLSLT